MQIPGRVGYQCSNFYRQLIKEGEIKDSNYYIDKNGKLVFRFKDKHGKSTLQRRHRSYEEEVLSEQEPIPEEVNVLPVFSPYFLFLLLLLL